MIPSGDGIAKRPFSLMPRVRPRIVIGIATTGRPAIVAKTIEMLTRQTRTADAIVICPAKTEDIGNGSLPRSSNISVVRSEPGLAAQRNAIVEAADKADVLVFFDDDFFPETSYLQEVEALFQRNPDIVMATGAVVADGISGPGISVEQAEAHLASLEPKPAETVRAVHNGYGCNMAVRMSAVRALDLRFDENLPLYAWLEDVDFSRRLAFSGRVVQSNLLRGVHLGNKGGRTSGVRLGYSQVINPLYMVRKGSISRGWACRQIARNLAANLVKMYRPEPWVDRKGRLDGNIRGISDAIRGRLNPRQMLTF